MVRINSRTDPLGLVKGNNSILKLFSENSQIPNVTEREKNSVYCRLVWQILFQQPLAYHGGVFLSA